MLTNRFKVVHKKTNKISEVYDVRISHPDTFLSTVKFLVYIDDHFVEMSADEFKPYEPEYNHP